MCRITEKVKNTWDSKFNNILQYYLSIYLYFIVISVIGETSIKFLIIEKVIFYLKR